MAWASENHNSSYVQRQQYQSGEYQAAQLTAGLAHGAFGLASATTRVSVDGHRVRAALTRP